MKINLDEGFSRIDRPWSPRIAAELNGQYVKLAKIHGAFDWHSHADEDEMFLVHRGSFVMEFRDHRVELEAGEFLVVPRGIEHRPVAEHETEIVLFEPASTRNTGDRVTDRTIAEPEWL